MASRNYAQVEPTAATIALNAYIYGYGGHSLVTPHVALKRLWWTDERIDTKITRAFVVSKLRGEEREFLDKPLAFGEGLTNDTYMEWILERAKRLFLILTDVGVPDQIFGCIDDSWDDEDLPLPFENVKNLELSYENDNALNKKFYDMQFLYLLRELKEGTHIDYGPKEHIPMEHVNTVPPAVFLQPYDRVHFPNRSDVVFMRRKFSLTDRETGQYHGDNFMRDLDRAKAFPHQHIAPTWATYTSEDAGFVLSDFVPEHTLTTFIEHRTPTQFLRVSMSGRPILLMEWMHCLSDALASLHHRGVAHTHIRPSNIWIDENNKIAFADLGTIQTLQRNKKFPKTEAYDYAAPEQQITQSSITPKLTSPPVSSMNAFSRLHKMSSISTSDSSSSISGSSGGSSTRSNSICNSPVTPASTNGYYNSLSTIHTAFSPSATNNNFRSSTSIRNFSGNTACPSPTIPLVPRSPTSIISNTTPLFSPSSSIDPNTLRDLPATTPSMSDIYSLACVFLDILTFLLKGKNSDFIKFRSSRTNSTTTGNTKLPKSRTDTSFHSSPDKIAAWADTLEEDSYRHSAQIFRGIPDLLRLIRLMLAQNAALRPTAIEVRDRIQEILVGECDIEALCCAGRQWAETVKDSLDDHSSTRLPFRLERDDLGDTTESPASPKARGVARCSTLCGDNGRGRDGVVVGSACVKSATGPSKMTATKSWRSTSASRATERLSSWRSNFLRH